MKKIIPVLAACACFALASCATITPITATSNPVGSKVGEASASYLFGAFQLGNADMGIQKAAKNGGIKLISTVDQKVSSGLFVTKVTTVVTGE